MAKLLDISTAVPRFENNKESLLKFYNEAFISSGLPDISKKLSFLLEKTKIEKRYSCLPDFEGEKKELFVNGNYKQSVERRMEVYKDQILPLAIHAIEPILAKNKVPASDVTHLITVSCTGLFAPGLEFLVAEHFGFQQAEKLSVNFLGCYAAIKALKHAQYIAQAEPNACILIVSAELCSLHFNPSVVDEDIIASLLFADGAAAAIICGDQNKHVQDKVVLNIDSIGSACIPNTAELMTWDISSRAFQMYLSRELVKTIKENIAPVVDKFLAKERSETNFWAIHPGGIRIVDAVKESLGLSEDQVEDSTQVLKDYGNMSSPTILFILHRILSKIRNSEEPHNQNIFACAFGPGLTVEMIQFTSVENRLENKSKKENSTYAVQR